MFVGYGLFHCGWAAYLLDEPGQPIMESHPWEGPRERSKSPGKAEAQPFETAEKEDVNELRTGFWQFVEEPAWQAVATRDRLQ